MRARGGTSRRPPHYRCRFPILPPAGRRFNSRHGGRFNGDGGYAGARLTTRGQGAGLRLVDLRSTFPRPWRGFRPLGPDPYSLTVAQRD